jgi:succinyl-diaminopimelate desuccinylase
MSADPVAIARDLLRCPSVTPAEGGALKFLESTLKAAGFTVHRMTFKEPGADDVENLYARIGNAAPHMMFAGHTDVVPPGDEKAWTHPPFSGEVADGELYGRGAVDMKGGIACAVAAALDHLSHHGGKPKGSISFLITGDEEGIAVNGTPKLLQWAAARGEKFDHCILGEPSNVEALGDTIKIGRRGSLNGHLIVTGKQGHVAYPQRAENPIRGLMTLVSALQAEPLDSGTALFPPSHLEFTSVDVGNKTVNLIPGEARARFNIRFNDKHTLDSLNKLIEQRATKAAGGKIKFSFQWEPSNAGVFVVKPGPFTDLVTDAITKVTERKPELSTSGGTSDARFIAAFCPVVEFGLVGQTMHAIDERVPIGDLRALTTIYRTILDRYFGG